MYRGSVPASFQSIACLVKGKVEIFCPKDTSKKILPALTTDGKHNGNRVVAAERHTTHDYTRFLLAAS